MMMMSSVQMIHVEIVTCNHHIQTLSIYIYICFDGVSYECVKIIIYIIYESFIYAYWTNERLFQGGLDIMIYKQLTFNKINYALNLIFEHDQTAHEHMQL